MASIIKPHLSPGLADYLRDTTSNPVLRDLLALLVVTTISRSSFSVHSLIIRRVIGSHNYGQYLTLMGSLPFMSRCHSYTPQELADSTGRQAHCKTWYYNGLLHTRQIGNINASLAGPSAGLVAWRFSDSFRDRLREAFQWYLAKHESAEQAAVFREIMSVVGGGLESLDVPELEFQDVLDICDGDEEKARVNWDVLSELMRLQRVPAECHFDLGHRVYHRLTNLKKGIRRLFRIRGEPVVEVDMHATFPAIIAARFAPDGERERLIECCQSGDFYGRMAELGIGSSGQKARFQREVVFSFRPRWSQIWQAFAREFPGTARRLSDIRDTMDVVVDEHVRLDANGRRYVTRTRWGQRRLSRILSRVESEIFLQRALLRVGVEAVPIHDCLMVAERHEERARQVIERAACEVLGFVPVVKVSRGGR